MVEINTILDALSVDQSGEHQGSRLDFGGVVITAPATEWVDYAELERGGMAARGDSVVVWAILADTDNNAAELLLIFD